MAATEPSQPSFDESRLLSDVELNQRMFECIEENGFVGRLHLDDPVNGPHFEFDVPPARESAYETATQECSDSFLERGLMRPLTRPTRDELRERYDYLIDVAECLAREGINVPEHPSLESYIDSDGMNWLPHAAVEDQVADDTEIERIYVECPQFP